MGADKAVHVLDDGLAGSDALATSLALAAALQAVGFDLVIFGCGVDGRADRGGAGDGGRAARGAAADAGVEGGHRRDRR